MRSTAEVALKLYEEAKSLRSVHEEDWRKAALHCLPAQYQSWTMDQNTQSNQRLAASRAVVYDSTGARSLPKYASVLERLLTPAGQKWHGLQASDPSLRKKRRVREYYDELSRMLFQQRYHPAARFRISTNEMYGALGVYGNGPMFIGERRATMLQRENGIKYISCHLKDVYMLVDDDGTVVTVFRRFWLNVRQFKSKFPDAPLPPKLGMEEEKVTGKETRKFEFVHYVYLCDEMDYDPEALDVRRHPVRGSYIAVEDKMYVGEESGFRSFPYRIPRTATASGDPYGYSPATLALASLGGASVMKKTNLKQGNKAVDPTLLAHDDNAINGEVDFRPGAVNYGAVSADGKALIQPLKTGDFRVGEVLLQDERGDIEDSFFVTLFQILNETPEMTATEVMERVAEKAALLSPTMGRLQTEFAGPLIEREIDIHAELGNLPEMPPELVEAEGDYEVMYTSPLAKSMYAEEVGGFMRTVEMAINTSQATQDPGPLDHFNFDVAFPEIADTLAVPARWMNTEDDVIKAREARQQQQQQDQLMKNASGLASAAGAAQQMEQGS